jgi:cytochrome c-type biogenesis protein CcmH/NrfF
MTTPTEPLQFDVAEDTRPAATVSAEMRCVSCQSPLTSYFDVNG